MVDGLHIHIQKTPMKSLATALSGKEVEGMILTNMQCKAIWNCHN
jgi:hypothetical protein